MPYLPAGCVLMGWEDTLVSLCAVVDILELTSIDAVVVWPHIMHLLMCGVSVVSHN